MEKFLGQLLGAGLFLLIFIGLHAVTGNLNVSVYITVLLAVGTTIRDKEE